MRLLLFILCFMSISILFAQDNPVGAFAFSDDLGSPKKAGSATYDASSQTYILKGAGYNIWFERDEFH